MEKGKLLDRLNVLGDERLLMARVLDKLEQTSNRNVPTYTEFLSPQEQATAADLLRLAGVGQETYCLSGGYAGAERKILAFLPDWMEPENAELPIRCLRAAFRPEETPTHRDFLGSLMGMGIVRERVGDLLVGSGSCDLLVADSVADFLLQSWESAGRTRLKLSAIEPEELRLPELRCEELRDTVAALRLDAVTATGFRMSRGKAAELIQSGRVQVNWRDCAKPDHLLREGDTVTARGFGKFVLTEVGGVTRKGRTGITVRRYL
jgi:RNA-binding protein YlmH